MPPKQGAGRRYLIQHSAGSGKSNSIAWLAHQLIGLTKSETKARARGRRGKREGAGGGPVFDSIIVVTDRRILDRQIHGTIKQYAQVGATVGHAERSGDLRRFIESGKKIIISTVQKFPLILDEIGDEQRRRQFAIIIDEAHSSQGGKTSAAMSQALSEAGAKRARKRATKTRSTGCWSRASCCLTPATSPLPPPPRTRPWRSSATPSGSGWECQASPLPQLHHEAGDRRGLHPRCAGALHSGSKLLPAE